MPLLKEAKMHLSKSLLAPLCALVLTCTAASAVAAAPLEEEWNAVLGGSGTDALTSFRQTADGGYLLLGDTTSAGAGSTDLWLVKTDGAGKQEWEKTYGGSSAETASAFLPTGDGGSVILGRTNSFGTGAQDLWLIKTDGEGNLAWEKTFGGPFNDSPWGPSALQQTRDGGYLLLGRTNSFGAGYYDIWLIKTDADGNLVWEKTFGGRYNDDAFSVLQTADGGFIVTGTTPPRGTDKDIWVIRVDADGNELWNRTYGGLSPEAISSFQQTAEGGYIILGTTRSFGAGSYDIWVVKTDAEGTVEWDRTFGGPNLEEALSIEQTSDGGYIILGDTPSLNAGGFDLWLIKTDPQGNKEWDRTYGGDDVELPRVLELAADGGYLLLGLTRSFGGGNFDLWLVKTDAEGNAEWDQTYGGWGYENAYVLDQAGSGYLLLGQTFSSGSGSGDAWLIKLGSGDAVSAPPTTAAALNGTAGDSGWYVTDVEVVLTAADQGAGVAATYYSLDGGRYVEGTQVLITTDGRHTLSYYSVDGFGNAEPAQSLGVDIDRTAPAIVVNAPQAGSYGNDLILMLDAAATDALSGCASVAYTLDGQPYDPAMPLDLIRVSLGSHVLGVAAVDQAGNAAEAAVTFGVYATAAGTAQIIDELLASGEIGTPGAANNLLTNMIHVLESIEDGQIKEAVNKIKSLLNYIDAQDGKQLSPEAAALLREYLGDIRATL